MNFITSTGLRIRLLACSGFILFSTCIFSPTIAQTVSDVLENGIVVKGREKIILKIEGDRLMYDVWHDAQFNPSILKDSSIFLVWGNGVNVYIKPFNPLNYSLSSATQFTTDQIQADAEKALNSLAQSFTVLEKASVDAKDKANKINDANAAANKKAGIKALAPEDVALCRKYEDIQTQWKDILSSLAKDQKKEIVQSFTRLKSLNFVDKTNTEKLIEQGQGEIDEISRIFGNVKHKIDDLREMGSKYDCSVPSPDPFVVQFIVTELAKQAEAVLALQMARLTTLKKAFDLVHKAADSANIENDGISWLRKINYVDIQKGKISNFALTIYNSGYELSSSDDNNNEIIIKEKKEVTKRILRVRKFQRFVPEVLAGTAYSFLSFPKFGTTADAGGKQVVSEAGQEEFKRVNFSVMVNFNYYVPNSQLRPFFQIGTGSNTDYPVFFTGAGIRINTGSGIIKAFSISAGAASTWIITLNKLKPGDPVSGTADLEKDITHEFRWPPKPYIGLQIKL